MPLVILESGLFVFTSQICTTLINCFVSSDDSIIDFSDKRWKNELLKKPILIDHFFKFILDYLTYGIN